MCKCGTTWLLLNINAYYKWMTTQHLVTFNDFILYNGIFYSISHQLILLNVTHWAFKLVGELKFGDTLIYSDVNNSWFVSPTFWPNLHLILFHKLELRSSNQIFFFFLLRRYQIYTSKYVMQARRTGQSCRITKRPSVWFISIDGSFHGSLEALAVL